MGSELTVTKSNALIEASYKLTLNEQRIILATIAQLDPRRPLPKENHFEITAEDFSKFFGVDEKNAYKELEEAASSLLKRVVKTSDGRLREHLSWLLFVRYWDGEGRVTLGFSPLVVPYLTMLHKRFTSYNLKKVSGLKSTYSIRLFEMLMQFRKTKRLVIEVNDFKSRLELKNKYERFFDLRKRVIEPAALELKLKSGINISWKVLKDKRKVKKIEFIFDEI